MLVAQLQASPSMGVEPSARRVRVLFVVLLAPGPIEAQVAVVFALPDDRMAVAREQLKGRISKFVIAAEIEQRGGVCLWSGQTFRPVIEELAAQRKLLADIALQEPACERKVAIAFDVVEKRGATAAVGRPWTKRYLIPVSMSPGPAR